MTNNCFLRIYKVNMKPSGIRRIIAFGPSLIRFFSKRDVGLGSKLLVFAALLYIIVPFDILPDFVPILGWVEDVIIGFLTYHFVNRKVTPDPAVDKNKDDDVITVDARVIEEDVL